MTVRWTVRAATDRARSPRESRVLVGPPKNPRSSERGFFIQVAGMGLSKNQKNPTNIFTFDRKRDILMLPNKFNNGINGIFFFMG